MCFLTSRSRTPAPPGALQFCSKPRVSIGCCGFRACSQVRGHLSLPATERTPHGPSTWGSPMCVISFFSLCVLGGGRQGQHPAVLRGSSWLCTQESLLVGSGTHGMLEIQPRQAMYKARALLLYDLSDPISSPLRMACLCPSHPLGCANKQGIHLEGFGDEPALGSQSMAIPCLGPHAL